MTGDRYSEGVAETGSSGSEGVPFGVAVWGVAMAWQQAIAPMMDRTRIYQLIDESGVDPVPDLAP
jgi:hypothetical protein